MQLRIKWKGVAPLRSTISIELIMTESVTSLSVLKTKQFAIHRKKKERRLRWYSEISKRKTKNLVECN